MSEEIKPEEEEIIIYTDTDLLLEYIQAAYFAMSSVDDVDEMVIPNEQMKNRIKRIKRKSIRIMDYAINKLYEDIFDEGPEEA
jgi:hypothetical protein